jgi:hypothetical protein
LSVLSFRGEVASPIKFRKSDFVPWKRGNKTSNRSEVKANATFLAKLSSKEIYLKMGLSMGSLKSNCLSHRGYADTFKLL